MSYTLSGGAESESNIEVHKYYSGTVIAVAFLAIVLQAFLHKYGRWSEFVDLPLLVTIYFGVSRRNPVTGLFLGAAIGLLQDALSHDNPIGLYGIAKTLVGYLASTVGARIDTQHPVSRFFLVFIFFHFHHAVFSLTERVLLNHPSPFFTWGLLRDSLANATLAVVLFAALDRFRRPS
jgi:rod shape-determining protein MreD